jgi:LysM repeat protein
MARRSPGRFLAPLALLAALAAVALVVNSATGGEDEGGSGSSGSTTATSEQRTTTATSGGSSAGTRTTTTAPSTAPGTTYTVKSGDTLGSIAETAGVPIETLQELNPGVDPQSLSVGQRLRLRR